MLIVPMFLRGKVDTVGHISINPSSCQRIVLVNPAQVTGEDQAVLAVGIHVHKGSWDAPDI